MDVDVQLGGGWAAAMAKSYQESLRMRCEDLELPPQADLRPMAKLRMTSR
ncbi:MAG: hypothetical protein KGN32_02705 [Burkholderiales bacterium]|nr:hypothetical protein [Burkholderiales bacterium]